MENTVVEEFRNGLKEIKSGVELTKNDIRATAENIKSLQDDTTQLRSDLDRLRRQQLNGTGKPKLRVGEAVTEDCARWFGALAFAGAELQGKLQGNPRREAIMHVAREVLGLETRSAITSTDIPLPIVYVGEVTELVYKYGQFRKYATVYPMSVGTVKLPQLKTSPAFGFINQSANVPEKSPQINFVTFTAQKAGGIVRIPSEIDEDAVVPLGQFIARYVARETARWEDTVGYLADGSGTYNSIKGIGKYCIDNSLVLQTATTKTKPSDITLADFRNVRAKVNGAALFNSAYYCHPSMEALLVSYNTSATVTPYIATISITYAYYPRAWSANPAIHLVYLLTEKLRGKGFDESKIHWPSANSLKTYCNEIITWVNSSGTYTGPRYQCNYVLDSKKPIQDHIRAVLDSCYAYLFLSQGKFVMKARKAETSIMDFDESNLLADSFSSEKIDRSSRCNRIHVFFHSADTLNAETEVIRDDVIDQQSRADRVGDNGIVEETLRIPAVTDQPQAERFAEQVLREEVNTRWTCEFKTNIKGLALEPGDVITVTHSSQPAWTQKLFRIEEFTYDDQDRCTLSCSEYFDGAYI